jgi:hypothetical protein
MAMAPHTRAWLLAAGAFASCLLVLLPGCSAIGEAGYILEISLLRPKDLPKLDAKLLVTIEVNGKAICEQKEFSHSQNPRMEFNITPLVTQGFNRTSVRLTPSSFGGASPDTPRKKIRFKLLRLEVSHGSVSYCLRYLADTTVEVKEPAAGGAPQLAHDVAPPDDFTFEVR